MEVTISQWAIQSWVIEFENDQGKIRESMQGRWQRRWILNEKDLRPRAINFLKSAKKDADVNLKVELFQTFINKDLLLNSSLDLKGVYGLQLPISKETARVWMKNLDCRSYDVYVDFCRKNFASEAV